MLGDALVAPSVVDPATRDTVRTPELRKVVPTSDPAARVALRLRMAQSKQTLGGEQPQEHHRGRVAVSLVESRNFLAKMAGVGVLLGLVAGVTSSGVSAAAPAKPAVPGPRLGRRQRARPCRPSHTHSPVPPPGYTVATSGDITAPAGAQTHGFATCPSGTVPFGGGAFVSSSSLSVNINSSIPLGTPGKAG